jgi:hypothetical protein
MQYCYDLDHCPRVTQRQSLGSRVIEQGWDLGISDYSSSMSVYPVPSFVSTGGLSPLAWVVELLGWWPKALLMSRLRRLHEPGIAANTIMHRGSLGSGRSLARSISDQSFPFSVRTHVSVFVTPSRARAGTLRFHGPLPCARWQKWFGLGSNQQPAAAEGANTPDELRLVFRKKWDAYFYTLSLHGNK